MPPLAAEKAWMIYRTVCEMLDDRGYTQVDEGTTLYGTRELFNSAVAPFGTIEKDRMSMTRANPETGKNLIVLFSEEDSIGIKPILALTERMSDMKLRHCILVYPKTVTAPAKKSILKGKLRIELFSDDELVMNITKHRLMPKHTLLNAGEKEALFQESDLKESQLTRILPTDPMAKYLGARRGDVIKVVRRSETAGRSIMYRFCN